jgi:hypothetical protein
LFEGGFEILDDFSGDNLGVGAIFSALKAFNDLDGLKVLNDFNRRLLRHSMGGFFKTLVSQPEDIEAGSVAVVCLRTASLAVSGYELASIHALARFITKLSASSQVLNRSARPPMVCECRSPSRFQVISAPGIQSFVVWVIDAYAMISRSL